MGFIQKRHRERWVIRAWAEGSRRLAAAGTLGEFVTQFTAPSHEGDKIPS